MEVIINTYLVSGGNPALVNAATAVGAGVAVYTSPAAVINATSDMIKLGQNLGEFVFNKVHPEDNLGPMIYKKEDHSRIDQNHKHPHPNNMHGDSFHASFGGF